MAFLRWLRIMIWIVCGAGFAFWLYWTYWVSPAIKPDFVSQGEYLNVDGTQVHFLEKGIGRCVILLPGFPLNAESYTRIMEYPWENRRVIALDLPEQGYSEKKGRPLSPEDFALTLKLFLDKLELQDVDLVGHDLGAGVAMVFAATYPHRVRKLVLLAPPLDGLATDALGPWWRWPLAGEVWSFFFLNQEWYRRWLTQGWTSPYASWQPVVEQYYRPLSTQAGRRGFLAVLRGCTGFAYNSYQERLQVPTLVIRGADDPFCPPGPLVRLQAALPQIIVKTLPQVGHFLPEEAPRQTYEMIREFIGVAERPEVLPEPAPQPEAAPALPPAPAPKPATAGRKRNALARAVERAKPVPQPTVTLILAPAMPAAAEPPAAVPAVAPAPAVPAAASDTREPAASAPTPAAQPAPALQP